MIDFGGKVLMITGGTGSFGNAVLERFLDSDIKEIRIFSRDEKKQDDMRRHYKDTYDSFHFSSFISLCFALFHFIFSFLQYLLPASARE